MTTKTILARLADHAWDGMDNRSDFDVSQTEYAEAAAQEVWRELPAELLAECKRIAGLIGPKCDVDISVSTDRGSERFLAITVYPDGFWVAAQHTVYGTNFDEVISGAEAYASSYIASHRVMTAEDIGIAA